MKPRPFKRREGMRRGIYLLPNMCTTASLFCGFYSVAKSLSGEFVAAAWLILLAGVFDMLDGRLARLAGAESEFGIEYDSLVDLSSFGLAPGILIYTWSLYGIRKIGWLAAFIYFACGALRLARFNVQHDDIEQDFFQGLPIPMAAYVLATYVIFHQHMFIFPPERSYLVVGMTMLLGLLMVSTIRYRSLKTIDLRNRNSFFALVILVFGIVITAIKPEVTLFVITLCYVASGLVEEIITQHQSRRFISKVKERREIKRRKKFEVVGGREVRPPETKSDDEEKKHTGTGGGV